MDEQELTTSILMSCQRALLGMIIPSIRLITIKWDDLDDFYFRVYYDRKPIEEDYEDMESVISEIVADISFKKVQPAECVFDTRDRNKLEFFSWTVYARKEEIF